MKRAQMPKRKDKKVFTRTASTPKRINLGVQIFRGGIRL